MVSHIILKYTYSIEIFISLDSQSKELIKAPTGSPINEETWSPYPPNSIMVSSCSEYSLDRSVGFMTELIYKKLVSSNKIKLGSSIRKVFPI